MFADADALMSKGNFEDAAKKFEDVDREHPYSPEARRAIVMAAYAYYKAGKLPEAIASAERYTTMHPGTKEAPLAHHIIAQSYFEQMKLPNRDQDATRKALAQLKTLKTRYPDSTYAQKADNQIRLCEDTLAAQEMNVGRYYMDKGNQIAAINRFKTVVQRLPDHRARRGSALPPDRRLSVARHRARGAERRRRAGAQLPQLALVQGFLRAAAEAGPDAAGQPGLVDDRRPAGPGEGPGAAACGHQAERPAAPAAPDWPAATTTPKGPVPPSSLGGPQS